MTVVPAKRRAEARRLTLLCAAVYFCSYLTRLDYGAVMVEMVVLLFLEQPTKRTPL